MDDKYSERRREERETDLFGPSNNDVMHSVRPRIFDLKNDLSVVHQAQLQP